MGESQTDFNTFAALRMYPPAIDELFVGVAFPLEAGAMPMDRQSL
jgi:hypothetical protein